MKKRELARYAGSGVWGEYGPIAQVWVNGTNTGGLGHVLPWLVSAYGRPDAIALKKEQEAHTLVGVVQHSSGRILRGRYR